MTISRGGRGERRLRSSARIQVNQHPSRYDRTDRIPANMRCTPVVCLMLSQRRRRWTNVRHTMGQYLGIVRISEILVLSLSLMLTVIILSTIILFFPLYYMEAGFYEGFHVVYAYSGRYDPTTLSVRDYTLDDRI